MSNPNFKTLGITDNNCGFMIGGDAKPAGGENLTVHSPINRDQLGVVKMATVADAEKAIDAASEAFLKWRAVPAPKRGEFVRRIGERLRARKSELAEVVCRE